VVNVTKGGKIKKGKKDVKNVRNGNVNTQPKKKEGKGGKTPQFIVGGGKYWEDE